MPRRAELPNLNPARLDIPNYRGDSLSARLTFQSQGVPVDVSLWLFLAYIRESPETEKIAEFTIYTTTHGADASKGIIRLVLPPETAQILPASCVWDLQTTDNASTEPLVVRTVLRGFVYTTPDITYAGSFGFPLSASRG